MALFGIRTEKNEKVDLFVKETNERLGSNNLVKNPFTGNIKSISPRLHIINMKPIYLNYPLVAFCFLFTIGLVFMNMILLTASVVFAFLSLIWTAPFLFLFLKIGLKRSGYKNKIKYLRPAEILEEIFFNG